MSFEVDRFAAPIMTTADSREKSSWHLWANDRAHGASERKHPYGLFVLVSAVFWLLSFAAGCSSRPDEFPGNRVLVTRLELTGASDLSKAEDETRQLLQELFGTPNRPKWPESLERGRSSSVPPLVRLERLERSAGPMRSNEQGVQWGLYRKHCVACHGIAGDGLGPASALLNPYPRDFRMGVFKWKRTPRGAKPSRKDLRRVLIRGIPGTAMPSFASLDDEDLEALIDYVIYLSVRGQFERELLIRAATEVDWEGGDHLFLPQWLPAEDGGEEEPHPEWSALIEPLKRILREWRDAEFQVPMVRPPTVPLVGAPTEQGAARRNEAPPTAQSVERSVARGRQLFTGTVAACSFCHGPDGTGSNPVNMYDDWVRDYTVMAGINPADTERLRPLLDAGALKPRPVSPRNLTWGVFRGGDEPEDLYLRVIHGIDGTPMPAAAMQPQNHQGLTTDDVWDLVNFTRNLSAETQGGDDDEEANR